MEYAFIVLSMVNNNLLVLVLYIKYVTMVNVNMTFLILIFDKNVD